MGFTAAQTYLSDILHVVSQSLLAPDIILLLAFILYALFSIGSVITEYFTERRHFKVVMPRFLAALMASKEEDIPQVIEHSGLLKRQKDALSTVYEYRALSGDALVALVRRLVSEEETRYDRITGRNNMAAKVTPMLGLMGTLIPLGPGIQALGTADTAALSSSLLVAFDTTVAGLVTAAICLVIGKIRSNWYNNYLSALDAAMATMMEKIEDGRETSTATLPEGAENYTFLFGADEPKNEKPAAPSAENAPAVAPNEAAAAPAQPEVAGLGAVAAAPVVAAEAGAPAIETVPAFAVEPVEAEEPAQDIASQATEQVAPVVEQVAPVEVPEETVVEQVAPVEEAVFAPVQEVEAPAESSSPAGFNFEPAVDPITQDKPSDNA